MIIGSVIYYIARELIVEIASHRPGEISGWAVLTPGFYILLF